MVGSFCRKQAEIAGFDGCRINVTPMKSTIYKKRNIGTGVAMLCRVNDTDQEKKTWVSQRMDSPRYYMDNVGMI